MFAQPKATGITLKLETINANDLQSRITSAMKPRVYRAQANGTFKAPDRNATL
jgi:hypothetical protein